MAKLGLEPDRLSYLCVLAAIYPSDSCGPTEMFGVQAQLQVLWQMQRAQRRACSGRLRISGGDSVPASHLSAELCDKGCDRDKRKGSRERAAQGLGLGIWILVLLLSRAVAMPLSLRQVTLRRLFPAPQSCHVAECVD